MLAKLNVAPLPPPPAVSTSHIPPTADDSVDRNCTDGCGFSTCNYCTYCKITDGFAVSLNVSWSRFCQSAVNVFLTLRETDSRTQDIGHGLSKQTRAPVASVARALQPAKLGSCLTPSARCGELSNRKFATCTSVDDRQWIATDAKQITRQTRSTSSNYIDITTYNALLRYQKHARIHVC